MSAGVHVSFLLGRSGAHVSASSSAPQWFLDMAELTVTPIAGGAGYGAAWQNGARITDVAPDYTTDYPGDGDSLENIMTDWTGGAMYQAGGQFIMGCQGGHDSYYPNEVYSLALRVEVPGWQRIWGPTPNAQIVRSEYSPSYNPPYTGYADSAPRTSHGWFSNIVTSAGRFITTFDDANPSGTWGTGCHSLDLTNTGAGWTFHGRLWETLPGPAGNEFLYQSGPGGYDPVANVFWRAAEGAVSSPIANGVVGVNVSTMVAAGAQSTGTGPQVPGSTLYNHDYGTALQGSWSVVLDDLSPRCWACANTVDDELWLFDVESPGTAGSPTARTVKTTSGSPTAFIDGLGAVYHKPSAAILVGGIAEGGSLVMRKLAISGSNPKTAAYTWSSVTLSGSTPSFDATQWKGSYSKWQLVEDMGNGQSLIVFATEVDGPTYGIKLPMAGV